MDTNLDRQSHQEIKYLKFLNETLQAKELRGTCDEFTRKIFDYLETKEIFDKHVFCAFVYKVLYICKTHRSTLKLSEENRIQQFNCKERITPSIYSFFTQNQICFTLSFFDINELSNKFPVTLQEKFKHLLITDEDSEIKPSLKIISPSNSYLPPSVKVNMDSVDLEFTLPQLTITQKLDTLHFVICALNYKSREDEYAEVVSKKVAQVRDLIISSAIKEGEQDGIYAENLTTNIGRIVSAQKEDPITERQWLDENPVLVNIEPLEVKKDFEMRKKVLALMLLTFQRLDLPEDIQKERVIEFFHGITGGSRKNLSDLLANPTANKDTVKSIKALSNDLNFVRDQLGKLGLSENVRRAVSEIDFLIEDLKNKTEYQ